MKYSLLFLLLLFILDCNAQNLLDNGDFEESSDCPTEHSQTNLLDFWFSPSNFSTPDYYHSCNTDSCSIGVPSNMFGNFNEALSGDAYVGFLTGGFANNAVFSEREYVSTELSSSLGEGATYEFSFYAKRSPSSPMASKLQAHFSEQLLDQLDNQVVELIPNLFESTVITDTEWMKYSTSYIATGNEKFLTIGNFQEALEWYADFQDSLLSFPICDIDGYDEYSYYFVDNVVLSIVTNNQESSALSKTRMLPNPSDGLVQLKVDESLINEPLTFTVYDMSGKLMQSEKIYPAEKLFLEVGSLKNGSYFVHLSSKNSQIVKKLIILK